MNEKISVVMSVYKENCQILKEALDSVVNQTYDNIEFVIVLDNPENIDAKKLINTISEDNSQIHFIFIENEINLGLSKSLNKGILASTGEYVARMDADDISYPERLSTQLEFLKENNADIVGCNIQIFSEENFGVNKVIKNPSSFASIKKALVVENCVPHPTWLLKRTVYDTLNYYRDIHTCEDYDFLLRAVQNGFVIINSEKIFLKYRYNNNSISRINASKQQCIKQYLGNGYKKGRIVNLDDLNNYIESSQGEKEINSIQRYYSLKDESFLLKSKNQYFKMFITLVKIAISCKFIYAKLFDKLKLKFYLSV